MFRYVETASQHDTVQVPVTDAVAPVTPEQIVADPPTAPQNHIPEQSTPPAEEADVGEVYNPSENGDVLIVEEEVPVSEVVHEVQDGSEVVAESDNKTGKFLRSHMLQLSCISRKVLQPSPSSSTCC